MVKWVYRLRKHFSEKGEYKNEGRGYITLYGNNEKSPYEYRVRVFVKECLKNYNSVMETLQYAVLGDGLKFGNKLNGGTEEMDYTFRRTKLSTLYKEIGRYLRENGDADIRSIASHNGCDEVSYTLKLADLNTFDTSCIGKIEAKYEDIPYTKEEWQNGVVTVSKIDIMESIKTIIENGTAISFQEALTDITPIDWSKDVLDGKYKEKVIIKSKDEEVNWHEQIYFIMSGCVLTCYVVFEWLILLYAMSCIFKRFTIT